MPHRSLGIAVPRFLAAIGGLALLTCVGVPGCPAPGSAARGLSEAPSLEEATGQARCGVRRSASKPLVVEWPATERAALEARAVRGLVAVRYEGCEMEVLTTCTATGAYDYVGLTQKREEIRITNADELYAQLPVGAVGLEAKLERSGQLNVDMVIVGRREAERSEFTTADLEGRCDAATHVVTGLTVGAYELYTGATASVGAGVAAHGAGVGARSSSQRELLNSDGDGDACSVASTSDQTPPEGCAALLRVEVVPIDRITVPTTTAEAEPAGETETPPSETTSTTDAARLDAEAPVVATRTGGEPSPPEPPPRRGADGPPPTPPPDPHAGEGFWCFSGKLEGKSFGECRRTKETCVARLFTRIRDGLEAEEHECVRYAQAACFSATRTLREGQRFMCYDDVATCRRLRARVDADGFVIPPSECEISA